MLYNTRYVNNPILGRDRIKVIFLFGGFWEHCHYNYAIISEIYISFDINNITHCQVQPNIK